MCKRLDTGGQVFTIFAAPSFKKNEVLRAENTHFYKKILTLLEDPSNWKPKFHKDFLWNIHNFIITYKCIWCVKA